MERDSRQIISEYDALRYLRKNLPEPEQGVYTTSMQALAERKSHNSVIFPEKAVKNVVILVFFIIFVNNIMNAFSQNYSVIIEDEITKNTILGVNEDSEKIRLIEQLNILEYNDLPGTFWVIDKPFFIEEELYWFDGYIFLNDNWMLIVTVDGAIPKIIFEQEEIQLRPNLFIRNIKAAIKYNIIDGKMVFDNKVFACLEDDTYLYFYNLAEDEFTEIIEKYRLETRFDIFCF